MHETRSQECEAWLRYARHGLAVDCDQTEGHGKALLPFEIVHERPVDIPFDRNSIVETVLHTGKRTADEFNTAGIIGDGNAVFRDDQIALEILVNPSNKPEQYKHFQFSILQLLEKTATADEVIQTESLWKKKLQTIAFGMNDN